MNYRITKHSFVSLFAIFQMLSNAFAQHLPLNYNTIKLSTSLHLMLMILCCKIVSAQIDEAFYGSRYNPAIMHTRISAKNANGKTGGNGFTSVHLMDFNFGGSGKYGSYFEGNVRVVSDAGG
jgi:hypothetical protein